MKPYYSKDGITIYHGRAEEIVNLLPDGHFGTLVLDAPFTFRAEDMRDVLRPFSRSLKDDCTILALSLTETVEKSPRFGHPHVRSLDQMRETLKWTEGAILDPYMGVGSSLLAARQLGREAVGIEIEEKWCALSVIRLHGRSSPRACSPETPQQILQKFAEIEYQDMTEYVPFLKSIAGGRVLEIGVCGGVSTSAFLIGMDDAGTGELVSIDKDERCAEILFHPRWTFLCDDSQTMPIPDHQREKFDVLMIDGDHVYESVASDLRRFSPLVRVGGLILNHDVLETPRTQEIGLDVSGSRKAWEEFADLHRYPRHILPGLFGLGVMRKTCAC